MKNLRLCGYRACVVTYSVAAILLMGLIGGPAGAAENRSALIETDQTTIQLLSATSGTTSQGDANLGLRLTLIPGWKTYWRTPGDAGFPLMLDWSQSVNLKSATLHWPVPHRFTLFGLDTFGYEREVIFPITVIAQDPSQPVDLRVQANYLVCEDICIPYQAMLSLRLPPGDATPTQSAQDINRFQNLVPGNGTQAGLSLSTTSWINDPQRDGKLALRLMVRSLTPLRKPDAIIENTQGIGFGAPRVSLQDNGYEAEMILPIFAEMPLERFQDQPFTLTFYDGQRAFEQAITPISNVTSNRWDALLAMIGIALLGGLILNIMPCVLPVLSLKLLGIVGQGGAEKKELRRSFLATAAGILFSFWGLAGLAIVLRQAGLAVGWGLQFQQPLFLMIMVALLVLFAGSLLGWLHIALPAGLMGRVAQIGYRPDAPHRESMAGAFFTGAFATLLATPCSAPILGTAIGFALARGALEISVIFTALGIGFAAPYLMVAIWPRAVAALPKPGAWMVRFKQILAVALIGTSLWLIWILATLRGETVAAATALLAAALLMMLALFRRRPAFRREYAVIALLVGMIIALGVTESQLSAAATSPLAGNIQNDRIKWQRFDAAAIPGLVAQGKTIFVDVTADWCVTCQINKRFVLGDDQVSTALSQPNVVAMLADWTKPDDQILAYLTRYGRYGIPFNAVYGPGHPQGIILPEVLATDAVLEAIKTATQ